MSHVPPVADETPYARLSPDLVLEAMERVGIVPDGRILALNSYENRVYQIGVEDGTPVVAKFYRPGRWSAPAIEEEHAFALELAAAEIPVVAPQVCEGRTLHECGGYLYAVYPRRGGRWPDLDSASDREVMGRFIGRLHAVGAVRGFRVRPPFEVPRLFEKAVDTIVDGDWLPDHQYDRYLDVTDTIREAIEDAYVAVGPHASLRIHGDCHRGNILWTQAGPHFVDLDDCVVGPAVQDLWMLVAGNTDERRRQWLDLLAGYEQFRSFDRVELQLVEPLRAFRMVHYAAWLARRWTDPAFPKAFPWFGSPRYWEDHVRELQEQAEVLAEGPIRL